MYIFIVSFGFVYSENTNNQKLMAEYEKYQELQARSQKLQEVPIMYVWHYFYLSAYHVHIITIILCNT